MPARATRSTTRRPRSRTTWSDSSTPASRVVDARAREQHGPGNPRWLDTYSYSDGSGNEVLRKVKAEPGLAPERDGNGALVHDAQGDDWSFRTRRRAGSAVGARCWTTRAIRSSSTSRSSARRTSTRTKRSSWSGGSRRSCGTIRSAGSSGPICRRHVLQGRVRCVEADVARSERHGAGERVVRGTAGADGGRSGAPRGEAGRGARRARRR